MQDDVEQHPSFDRAARLRYLEALQARYGAVTLPIGPAQGSFALQAVFQPLKLRHDPLAAEDLAREQRRAQSGDAAPDEAEASAPGAADESGEDDPTRQQAPVVLAENGAEALAKSATGRMVVLGGPGTGKTTVLKHLIGEQARRAQHDPAAPLPLFIALPDLARSGKTLEAYLPDLLRELGIEPRYAQALWEAIVHGQAFVCLDSLDEVAPLLRPDMITLVNRWALGAAAGVGAGGVWVIGSRFTEYKGGQFAPGRFAEWELQPLDDASRLELARRLLPILHRLLHGAGEPPPDALAFVAALAAHPQAAAWGENPLLFSLAAVVYAQAGALPASRAALYQQVVEAVLKTRAPDENERAELLGILADLALHLHQTKGRTFTLADLIDLLPRLAGGTAGTDARYHLAHRLLDSGMFDVVSRETYGFRHQTFQEYLAAVALARSLVSQDEARRSSAWDLAWSKRTYSRWTEVLRLMVGVLARDNGPGGAQEARAREPQARRWLEALMAQRAAPEGDPGDLGLTLALRSLGELAADVDAGQASDLAALGGDIGALWARELLDSLLQNQWARERRLEALADELRLLSAPLLDGALAPLLAALADEDWMVRQAGARALAALKERAPQAALLGALRDAQQGVRAAAIRALGGCGPSAPVEALLGALDDSELQVRTAASDALGGLGTQAPVQALVARLGAASADTRRQALGALVKLRTFAPVEALTSMLNDPDKNIRAEAARGLARRGDPAGLEAALALLRAPDPDVRRSVLLTLRWIEAPLPPEPLLATLEDSDERVRHYALHLMGRLGERAPIPLLLAALRGQDVQTRGAAGFALAKLGALAPLTEILAALKDQEPGVRQVAVRIVAELGERAPLGALIAALKDPDEEVRKIAAEKLGKRGKLEATGALVAALNDSAWSVRVAAAGALGALGALGERGPLERLLAVLGESSPEMRCIAAAVLGELRDQAPLDVLLVGLRDGEASVRAATVRALGKLGERVPLDALLGALRDNNEHVRAQAVLVLGDQGERVPVEALAGAVSDSARWVRQLALRVLGKLGERAPVEVMVAALSDSDGQVRRSAVEALSVLGERAPLESLLAALNDSDEWVRYEALEALGRLSERAPAERLREALRAERWQMRAAAARGLGHLGDGASIDLLIEALKDSEWSVRNDTAAALEQSGQRVPIEPLLALYQASEGLARFAVLRVLAAAGARVPIEVFVTALNDPDQHVKKIAAEALGSRGDEAPLEPLLALLGSDDYTSRYAAVQALEKLGERVPLEPLLAAAQDREWGVRVQAAKVLAKRGRADGLEMLIKTLGEGNDYLVEDAIGALAELGTVVPVEPLLLALGDTSEHIYGSATTTLGKTHPEALLTVAPEAAAILRGERGGAILGSHALSFMAWTIRQMKRVPPPLLEKLTELLDWHYWDVRLQAAAALGEIRRSIPDAAIRRLLRLRHDPQSQAVREAADEALAKILSLETGIEDD